MKASDIKHHIGSYMVIKTADSYQVTKPDPKCLYHTCITDSALTTL